MLDAERALRIADRERVPVQLPFCDLDDLKGIDDRHGHKVGDETLQRFGAAIAGAIREIDVGAHLSGDEFVVLLYAADGAMYTRKTVRRIHRGHL